MNFLLKALWLHAAPPPAGWSLNPSWPSVCSPPISVRFPCSSSQNFTWGLQRLLFSQRLRSLHIDLGALSLRSFILSSPLRQHEGRQKALGVDVWQPNNHVMTECHWTLQPRNDWMPLNFTLWWIKPGSIARTALLLTVSPALFLIFGVCPLFPRLASNWPFFKPRWLVSGF